MATIDYHKLQQSWLPMKPGANWWFIRVDWAMQPAAAGDVFRLAEIKNHWIIKGGFVRATTDATPATASIDLETSAGVNTLDTAFDPDSGDDVWVRLDQADDDAPLPVQADGYLQLTVNTVALNKGITDFLVEVIIPHDAVDAVDQIGS